MPHFVQNALVRLKNHRADGTICNDQLSLLLAAGGLAAGVGQSPDGSTESPEALSILLFRVPKGIKKTSLLWCIFPSRSPKDILCISEF